VSPPYVPVTVAVPMAVPVKVTVQLPDERLQLDPLNEPVPVDVKVTAPDGVVPEPVSVSATVTVQVEARLTETGLVQVTVVEVDRGLTVIPAALALELAA